MSPYSHRDGPHKKLPTTHREEVPINSQNFSSNLGSFDSLNVSTRCGFKWFFERCVARYSARKYQKFGKQPRPGACRGRLLRVSTKRFHTTKPIAELSIRTDRCENRVPRWENRVPRVREPLAMAPKACGRRARSTRPLPLALRPACASLLVFAAR